MIYYIRILLKIIFLSGHEISPGKFPHYLFFIATGKNISSQTSKKGFFPSEVGSFAQDKNIF